MWNKYQNPKLVSHAAFVPQIVLILLRVFAVAAFFLPFIFLFILFLIIWLSNNMPRLEIQSEFVTDLLHSFAWIIQSLCPWPKGYLSISVVNQWSTTSHGPPWQDNLVFNPCLIMGLHHLLRQCLCMCDTHRLVLDFNYVQRATIYNDVCLMFRKPWSLYNQTYSNYLFIGLIIHWIWDLWSYVRLGRS